jgi:hypothetical protein
MPSRSLILSIALLFAAVYAIEGFLFRDYNEDEFQVATAYLKDRDPSLYSADFIWGKPEMIQNMHVCIRSMLRVTEIATFGLISEPVDYYLIWLFFGLLLFFFGNYLLCLRFTGNPWASLFVACAFMLVRRTIWDWWGLGPTFTMSARGMILSFLPLALWLYFRYEKKPLALFGLFFAWGLLSNLHPLSGWGFVELLGITILISERFTIAAWKKVLILGTATLIGSIPFILIWRNVAKVPLGFEADPNVIKGFWDGFHGLEMPSAKFIIQMLEDLAIPAFIGLFGFMTWIRMNKLKQHPEIRVLTLFPFVAILMTIFVMIAGHWLKRFGIPLPVMIPEHSRTIKFIYLTIPVWMTFGIDFWLERVKAHQAIRYGIPILLLLISMGMNFPGHKLARYFLMKQNWVSTEMRSKELNRTKDSEADLEVALWARAHTPANALFYFDSYEFRYYARRSLVFCWFDRPCVGFHPSKELEEWIARRDQIKKLSNEGNSEGMKAVAQKYGAQYLVIRSDWKPLTGRPVWTNWKYSVYTLDRNLLKNSRS